MEDQYEKHKKIALQQQQQYSSLADFLLQFDEYLQRYSEISALLKSGIKVLYIEGYNGIGKTTIVNKALKEIKDRPILRFKGIPTKNETTETIAKFIKDNAFLIKHHWNGKLPLLIVLDDCIINKWLANFLHNIVDGYFTDKNLKFNIEYDVTIVIIANQVDKYIEALINSGRALFYDFNIPKERLKEIFYYVATDFFKIPEEIYKEYLKLVYVPKLHDLSNISKLVKAGFSKDRILQIIKNTIEKNYEEYIRNVIETAEMLFNDWEQKVKYFEKMTKLRKSSYYYWRKKLLSKT